MRSISRCLGCVVVLGLLLAPERASAQQEEGWRIKLSAAYLQPTGESTATDALSDDFSGSAGVGLALEYRVSQLVGVEVGVLTGEFESTVRLGAGPGGQISVLSEFDAVPVLAKLNFHLTPEKKADLYVGPVIGWIRYSDVDTRFMTSFPDSEAPITADTNDGFAWGGHVSLDFSLGNKGVFLTGGITYLKAELEENREEDQKLFDVDPLVTHFGIGYRF